MNLQRKDTQGTIKFYEPSEHGDVPVATFFNDEAADLFALVPEMIAALEANDNIDDESAQIYAGALTYNVLEKVRKAT